MLVAMAKEVAMSLHCIKVRALTELVGQHLPKRQVFDGLQNQSLGEEAPAPARGLAGVSSYARFIAAHPDMPRAHRDRFLNQIVRCCEEASSSGLPQKRSAEYGGHNGKP